MIGPDRTLLMVPLSAGVPSSSLVNASALPLALSFDLAADAIHSHALHEPDMSVGPSDMWVLDQRANFISPPLFRKTQLIFKDGDHFGAHSFEMGAFNVGRGHADVHLQVMEPFISRQHLRLQLYPLAAMLENLSDKNPLLVGGRQLKAGEKLVVKIDAPFVIAFGAESDGKNGTILISPKDAMLAGALAMLGEQGEEHRALHVARRAAWRLAAPMQEYARPFSASARQAVTEGADLVTPEQVRLAADIDCQVDDADAKEEALRVRLSLRNWVDEGRLDAHVRGKRDWQKRLIANVRNGGVLLPTHSTDLDSAVSILKDGFIDPKHFKKKRAFFRCGLGHSYGEIVFIQGPGQNLGRLNDIWAVMNAGVHRRIDLMRLVGCVNYNRNVPLREDADKGKAEHEGRTCAYVPNNAQGIMELFPQYETDEPVSIDRTYAVLVPEHFYDELLSRIPPALHELIILVPGTGRNGREFLEGRDKVARRTRWDGGTFEPVIGYEALYRYELVYFKAVETFLRMRHIELRARLEKFAEDAYVGRLSHDDIVRRVMGLLPYVPEAFFALHTQKQFPSHDGHSPFAHTLNALIEAAYLAPAVHAEFPEAHIADVFMALLFHDEGKVKDAKSDDHDAISIEMARYHLKMMGLAEDGGEEISARRQRILDLIDRAGLVSEATYGVSDGAYRRIRERIGTLLPEVLMMNLADTGSIPGRSGRTMKVNTDYDKVIDVRPALIKAFRRMLSIQVS